MQAVMSSFSARMEVTDPMRRVHHFRKSIHYTGPQPAKAFSVEVKGRKGE